MKISWILLSVLCYSGIMGQHQESEKMAVQRTIATFFKGFHAQDSVQIRATVSDEIILQTVGKDNEGNDILRSDDFDQFLNQIVSIPETTKFEEKIISYTIQVDGSLAHAWTGYEFWVNGKRSHCGVNSFQLFNDGGRWKIIYLIDTRRKSDCP